MITHPTFLHVFIQLLPKVTLFQIEFTLTYVTVPKWGSVSLRRYLDKAVSSVHYVDQVKKKKIVEF